MTQILRRNATDTITVGPFVDSSSGQPITNASASAMDTMVAILPNGTNTDISGLTFAADGSANGMYDLTLTVAVTSAVGPLSLYFVDTDRHLPRRETYQVMGSSAFDALYASAPTILTAADVKLLYESSISTVTTQTQWDMTDTLSTNDVGIGNEVSIIDTEDTTNFHTTWITDLQQASDRIVVASAPPFTLVTASASDYTVRIYADAHPGFHSNAQLGAYGAVTQDKLLGYVQLMTRSDAAIATDRNTEIGEINQDEGSGAGDFDNQTDSLEHGNTKRINNTAVTGTGTSGDKWRG